MFFGCTGALLTAKRAQYLQDNPHGHLELKRIAGQIDREIRQAPSITDNVRMKMAPLNELVRVSGGVYVLTEEWIDEYSLVSCHRFTIQLVL